MWHIRFSKSIGAFNCAIHTVQSVTIGKVQVAVATYAYVLIVGNPSIEVGAYCVNDMSGIRFCDACIRMDAALLPIGEIQPPRLSAFNAIGSNCVFCRANDSNVCV